MARPLRSLTLFAREAEVPRQVSSVARLEPRQPELWLSICLPNLALEALGLRSAHEPLAVTELGREQLLIAAANDAARAHGVRRGLRLNAAMALAASLDIPVDMLKEAWREEHGRTYGQAVPLATRPMLSCEPRVYWRGIDGKGSGLPLEGTYNGPDVKHPWATVTADWSFRVR